MNFTFGLFKTAVIKYCRQFINGDLTLLYKKNVMKIRSITIGAIIAIGATTWFAMSCNKDGIEPNGEKQRPSGVRNDETILTNTYSAKHVRPSGVRNDETVMTNTYTAKHARPSGLRNDQAVQTNTYTSKFTKSEGAGNDEAVLQGPK